MHWPAMLAAHQLTGQLKGHKRPHAVPPEDSRFAQKGNDRLGQERNQVLKPLHWRLTQALFASRQRHQTPLDVGRSVGQPGPEEHRTPASMGEAKQADLGLGLGLGQRKPRCTQGWDHCSTSSL